MRFPNAVRRDPAVDAWMRELDDDLRSIAEPWFGAMRDCGNDVRELMHDGHATACVGDAAFAYVAAFTAHVNVGFFHGAELADPKQLLEGTGKYMRHVKLKSNSGRDPGSLLQLIADAYKDIKLRLDEE